MGPCLPFIGGGTGPSPPFVHGGTGPLSPFMHGGVGPHLPFMHGGAGSLSLFVQPGMGPRSPFVVLGPCHHSCNLAWVLVRCLCLLGPRCCWGLVVLGPHCCSLVEVLAFVDGVAGHSSHYLWVVVVPLVRFCVPWCVGPRCHWRVRVMGHCLFAGTCHCSWVPVGSRWWMAVAFVGLVMWHCCPSCCGGCG